MFNSLKYAKVLEDAGLPRNQAETHIQIISEVLEEDMASKADIVRLETSIETLETSLKTEVMRLEEKIEKSEYNIIFKLGSLMTILIGCAVGVMSSLV